MHPAPSMKEHDAGKGRILQRTKHAHRNRATINIDAALLTTVYLLGLS
jgi:hypothetical protein